MKRLRPWLWAAGTLIVAIASAIFGAFRRGKEIGKAEGKYEADVEKIDEIADSGDTTKMREDLLRRGR